MMIERIDTKRLIAAIAKRIRERRAALGITQEELADRAQISSKYVSTLEVGWLALSLPAPPTLPNTLTVHL